MTESLRPTTDPNAHDEVSLQRLNHLIWALLFFALALFAKLPGLDLLISARYYDPELGFFHRHHPVVIALYDWTPWIGRALVIALALYALLAPLLARYFDQQRQHSLAQRARGSWRHLATVAVVCGLLGPGLIIEGIFKNQMGRPRPVQVVEFGGTEVAAGRLMNIGAGDVLVAISLPRYADDALRLGDLRGETLDVSELPPHLVK